ncbi:hypothetical protein CTI12_AA555760 [Artemisia annua]|uniref:Uncharacterized protein n=1 Tax=Artemisia annua TaxID=35608 RepID=A0A2U1KWT1_ARTAN|nr:hypothetical protein CTI12_AA555760 [Artemisia annua]
MAGFNVEKVQYKNVIFTPWDVGDQQKARPLWRRYFNDRIGLINATDPTVRNTDVLRCPPQLIHNGKDQHNWIFFIGENIRELLDVPL